jgi:putative DNA primase/helicase
MVTEIMSEREDFTDVPVATSDLPEEICDQVLLVLEELACAAELPQFVQDLPEDVTHVDVAQSLVELYRPNIRYNAETQTWFVFDPRTGWRRDPLCHQISALVVETLRTLADFVPKSPDKTTKRRFAKIRRIRTRRMENSGAIKGIVNLAAMDTSIHCASSDIDDIPWVIGTPDGMVHLSVGEWMPFGAGLFVTRRTLVHFDEVARCDRWEEFLREVLGDDDEVQSYFQQLVGYLLTGDTRLQQMWLLIGSGSNGKSTLLHILQKMLGPDYAQQTPESVLLGRPNVGGATNDLVRLKGVRCALLAETGHGQCFNEERVKALVASDTIAARGLYHEFEEFIPQAKFLLATNHLPIVRGTDKGIWRRLVVVPFNNEFEVGSDPTLYQDLVAELPGIFAWAVRGAVRWYDSTVDFTVPSAWSLATNQYRAEHDALKGYLDERAELNKAAFVGATELYNDYIAWCALDGRQSLSQSEFGQRMMATGLVTKERKFKANRYHYLGVALRPAVGPDARVRLDGVFDNHSATPPGPSLISPDSLLMEVTP